MRAFEWMEERQYFVFTKVDTTSVVKRCALATVVSNIVDALTIVDATQLLLPVHALPVQPTCYPGLHVLRH